MRDEYRIKQLPRPIKIRVFQKAAVKRAAQMVMRIPNAVTAEVVERGYRFKTGVPVTFPYLRGKAKAPDMGTKFQQAIEPAGKYLILDRTPGMHYDKDEYEKGQMTFLCPLVLPFNTVSGETYTETSWKRHLSAAFGGLTGADLTDAVVLDGYDGVVTVGVGSDGKGYDTREIVFIGDVDRPAVSLSPSPA